MELHVLPHSFPTRRSSDLNVRNNFAPKIKEDAPIPSQEELDTYVANYEFGVRAVASTDPVEKEMIAIVENAIVMSLKKQGLTKKSFGTENFNAKVEELLADPAKNELIREKAKQVVATRAAALNFDIA